MEMQMRAVFAAALLIVPILLLLRKFYEIKSGGIRKLPPSPPSSPIFGHLHLLGTLPHRSFAHLSQQYGPLMHLRPGSKPALVVTSSEMARELYKNHDLVLSHRPQFTVVDLLGTPKQGMAFQSNTPLWRHLRKIFMTESVTTSSKISSNRIELFIEVIIKRLSCESGCSYCDQLKSPPDGTQLHFPDDNGQTVF